LYQINRQPLIYNIKNIVLNLFPFEKKNKNSSTIFSYLFLFFKVHPIKVKICLEQRDKSHKKIVYH